MESPAGQGDLANVEEMLKLAYSHVSHVPYEVMRRQLGGERKRPTRHPFVVLSLNPRRVPEGDQEPKAERYGGKVPNDGCTQKIVLDLVIAPSAHSQTESEERPVERERSEDIFFIGVGDECVV